MELYIRLDGMEPGGIDFSGKGNPGGYHGLETTITLRLSLFVFSLPMMNCIL